MSIRQSLHAVAEFIADSLENRSDAARYYDQHSSPLPKETYLRLVRRGVLNGFRLHGRVLVLREDMHAYIEQHRVEPSARDAESEDDAVGAALSSLGIRKVG